MISFTSKLLPYPYSPSLPLTIHAKGIYHTKLPSGTCLARDWTGSFGPGPVSTFTSRKYERVRPPVLIFLGNSSSVKHSTTWESLPKKGKSPIVPKQPTFPVVNISTLQFGYGVISTKPHLQLNWREVKTYCLLLSIIIPPFLLVPDSHRCPSLDLFIGDFHSQTSQRTSTAPITDWRFREEQ